MGDSPVFEVSDSDDLSVEHLVDIVAGDHIEYIALAVSDAAFVGKFLKFVTALLTFVKVFIIISCYERYKIVAFDEYFIISYKSKTF